MHILFLTTQLPYPPKSGGVIKSWNLVAHWSAKYELSLVHPLKNDEAEHLEEFKSKVSLKNHFCKEVHRARTGLNLLRSYLGHATLNVFRNYDLELKSKIDDLAREVDIIVVDHYEMGQYVPRDFQGKVVLHEHNAEFVMWQRLAELESNPLKRFLLKTESKRILRAEMRYAERAHLVLAAPNDVYELSRQGVAIDKMERTYHLGEDFMLSEPDMQFDQTQKALLYVGTLSWEANVDGLIWFINECWPQLIRSHPDLRLTIVGKNPDARILSAAANYTGIDFAGFVEDLEEAYPHHRVFIVPLRFGSGIKVKVLNALYRGIPMVTTFIGTEGLDVQNGIHLYECRDETEFVQGVERLLGDRSAWEQMRDKARTIAKDYTWESLLADHDQRLENLLHGSEHSSS